MKQFTIALISGFLLLHLQLVVAASANPIYVVKEKDGSVRFTTREPREGVQAQVFTARKGSFARYSMKGYRKIFNGGKLSRRYWDVIERAAIRYGLERHLIQAVIHVESYFDPLAVSPKGARGLMQLMPDTARMLRVKNSFEAEANVMGGTRYLSFLLRRFRGNLRYALAAYNAGEGAVEKYNGIPPYDETLAYVDEVLRMKKRYEVFANG